MKDESPQVKKKIMYFKVLKYQIHLSEGEKIIMPLKNTKKYKEDKHQGHLKDKDHRVFLQYIYSFSP